MRISHKHKFIYYSIPKTASESVRFMLDSISDVKIVSYPQITAENPYYSHMRPCEVKRIFDAQQIDFDEYFSFATVRNPWKRMASLFYMARRYAGERWRVSFKEWLGSIDPENLVSPPTNTKWYDHGLLNYATFLEPGPGARPVNKIFRIEDGLEKIIDVIRKRRDLDDWSPKILDLNVRPNAASSSYAELYDDDCIEIVRTLFSSDIEAYDYRYFG